MITLVLVEFVQCHGKELRQIRGVDEAYHVLRLVDVDEAVLLEDLDRQHVLVEQHQVASIKVQEIDMDREFVDHIRLVAPIDLELLDRLKLVLDVVLAIVTFQVLVLVIIAAVLEVVVLQVTSFEWLLRKQY